MLVLVPLLVRLDHRRRLITDHVLLVRRLISISNLDTNILSAHMYVLLNLDLKPNIVLLRPLVPPDRRVQLFLLRHALFQPKVTLNQRHVLRQVRKGHIISFNLNDLRVANQLVQNLMLDSIPHKWTHMPR